MIAEIGRDTTVDGIQHDPVLAYCPERMATLTRQSARLTACTPAVADSDGYSANTTDDTLAPGPTRSACHRLTTFTPAIVNSAGGALNTADHALDYGANHPAGHRCRRIAHLGHRLTCA